GFMHSNRGVTDPASATRSPILTAAAVLAAGVGGAIARRIDVAAATLTLFVAAMSAIDLVIAWIAAIDASARPDGKLFRTILAAYVVTILAGTAVLAVPLATYAAVPDYLHNFWRHVSFCAQSAASAVCLVGSSGYDIGTDFSPFGRF